MKITQVNLKLKSVKCYLNPEDMKDKIFLDNKGLSGIYKWINKITGDIYIGSGINLTKRIRNYYQSSELNKNPRHINRAILKYGHKNFILEIVEYCDKDKLMEREQFYLDKLNPSYNILKQAYSLEGFRHTAETIENLKNREFTLEHRDNLSKANIGREFSEDTLKKLSKSMKDYHIKHPLTPEALLNIKEKTTVREGVSVVLVNQDTGKETEFITQTEAGKFLNVSRQAIRNALNRNSLINKLYRVKLKDKI